MPFQKGKSGNPEGRKKSKSARLTADLHQAVAADAMTIVKSIIASAKSGDVESRRAFLKLLPQGKWPTPFERPKVAGPEDIPPAIDAVLDAAAKGDLSLDDAELVVGIINGLWQAYETTALRADPVVVEGGDALRLGAVVEARALSDFLSLRGVERRQPRRACDRRWRN
jgi:hypothetical protein